MARFPAVAALLTIATVLHAQTPATYSPHLIPRFALEFSGLSVSGPARVGADMIDEGGRAAIRASETGAVAVFANGVRIARDVRLSFLPSQTPDSSVRAALAQSVIVRPEGLTIIYSHPTFTVREHVFAPLNEPGAIMIIEAATLRPLTIRVNGVQGGSWTADSAGAATQYMVVALGANDSVRARLTEHARQYWQEKVAYYRKVRTDALSLSAPDASTGQALDWVKVAIDRRNDPQNVLAYVDLGESDIARVQLMNAAAHSELDNDWVRAAFAYWRASADDLFLRAYWPAMLRALQRPHPDTLYAARLSALDAVGEMARGLRDRVAADYARQQSLGVRQQLANASDTTVLQLATAMSEAQLDAGPAEALLQRIGASEFTADWGTRVLSRYDARYDPLRWDRGAISTYATGVIALADYRYHRAWAGFDLVRDIARETFDFTRGMVPALLSGAYYQVLSAPAPAAMQQPVTYVSAIVRGLLGWEVDVPNRAAALEPHLPADWTQLDASNLRVGRDRLDVSIVRAAGVYSISLHRLTEGSAISLRLAPALPLGARVDRIVVDDQEVPVQSEETAHDLHAVIELSLTGDAQVDIHYSGGIEIGTPPEHIEAGEASHELKILDFGREEREYVITVEGVADEAYVLPLRTGWRVRSVAGSDGFDQSGERVSVRVTMPAGNGFVTKSVKVRVSE